MSLQFAPQWVKPIKPSGTTSTPTIDGLPNVSSTKTPVTPGSNAPPNSQQQPSVPFPALGSSNRSSSPSTALNPGLSYSRVTHTPQSPSFPSDGSYFPNSGDHVDHKYAFRYTKEQMLGLWEEDKVKELPIELVQLLEDGGVLVRREVVKPAGLRDMTDIEKKLFSTSIHPPAVNRRQVNNANHAEAGAGNTPNRRAVASNTTPKDPASLANSRNSAFGAFGRGEGGALGGGTSSAKFGTIGGAAPTEPGGTRAPGALGGGFGGVGRRMGSRRTESSDIGADAPRTGSTWRPTRTQSGTFEGVLGFGGTGSSAIQTPGSAEKPSGGSAALHEPEEKKEGELFGAGGGPGWGTGQKKWRMAAGINGTSENKILEIPATHAPSSASNIATPSVTPLPERDAAMQDTGSVSTLEAEPTTMTRESSNQDSTVEQKENLAAIEWYYRDPNGQEQGPFSAANMHDWYSHSYFQDDLPIRRSEESDFHTLAELKTRTGNAVQPFLAPIKPRAPPPNLPLPTSNFHQQPLNGHTPLAETFRALNMASPAPGDPRISPHPMGPGQNYGFAPERAGPYSPNHFASASPFQPIGSPAHVISGGGQWPPRAPIGGQFPQPAFGMGSRSSSGFAPGPQPFAAAIGAPGPIRPDPFGAAQPFGGIPSAPWGPPQPPYQQQPLPQQLQQQYQPMPQPLPSQEWPSQQEFHGFPGNQVQQPMAPQPQDEPSYFPHGETAQTQVEQPEVQPEAFVQEEATFDSVDAEEVPEEEVTTEEIEEYEEPEPVVSAPNPPQSVWEQRRAQIQPVEPITVQEEYPTPSATPSATTTKTPSVSTIPTKPTATRSDSTSEPLSAKPSVTPSTEKPSAPKPAPWAVAKEESTKNGKSSSTGPSLREIQELEAKRAEARKAALAEAREKITPIPTSTISTSSEDNNILTSMAWGLASSGSGKLASTSTVPSPVVNTPTAPAWGSGDAAPKKTLKQIQEEEEKRQKKIAAAKVAASGATTSGGSVAPKRGYADLAATSTGTVPGWTTVGSGGKGSTTPAATIPGAAARAAPAPSAAKPTVTVVPSRTASATPTPAKANGSKTEESGPSVEFIKWTKGALNGLTVNVDDFIQMLLSFPADPPASQKADVAEIIADSVYASSSTLDGRRFAQEFMTKRKIDANRLASSNKSGGGNPAKTITSLADVVKTVPKPVSAEAGFKIVKAKGKKKN